MIIEAMRNLDNNQPTIEDYKALVETRFVLYEEVTALRNGDFDLTHPERTKKLRSLARMINAIEVCLLANWPNKLEVKTR